MSQDDVAEFKRCIGDRQTAPLGFSSDCIVIAAHGTVNVARRPAYSLTSRSMNSRA